ncbi:MAG: chemotaxis protein CheW [Myxococcota bacterium]|jgi:purine-binding chemotaxis protein CheW|nr:chemotaxis protein CheW [Myxococcota bacterium]
MTVDPTTNGPVSEVSLACFEVGGRCYALDVGLVREIVRIQPITPLPDAPVLIEGVAEMRSGMVPVLDLARVLGATTSGMAKVTRIVVLDCEGLQLGLAVQAATNVMSVDPAFMEEVPDLAAQAGYEIIRSVVRRPGEPPVMVLAVEAIIEAVYRSTPRASASLGENA